MTTDLLRQNTEMRRDRVWNWTLPAWVARRTDGVAVNVCPQAGACIQVCYARNGTYNFPGVKAAHVRNLEAVQDDLGGWVTAMLTELGRRKFRPTGDPRLPGYPRGHLHPVVAGLLDGGAACVRIHDAGDFFADDYLLAWATIADLTPDVLFYAYTKEVARVRRVLGDGGPVNLLVVYSLGGKQDHLLDLDVDRHADVFPTAEAIEAAGYESQDASDLLSVVSVNHRVGIPANNIPAFRKRLAGRTFGELEETLHRHGRPAPAPS